MGCRRDRPGSTATPAATNSSRKAEAGSQFAIVGGSTTSISFAARYRIFAGTQSASYLGGISRAESFYCGSRKTVIRSITRKNGILLMPLVRIDLIQGKSSDYRGAIGEVIYEAMLAILNVPKNDRFQVITEHPVEAFLFDPTYLDIQRSNDCIFIQLTLNEGRTVEQKQRFYKAYLYEERRA
jgi:hypothetical protein